MKHDLDRLMAERNIDAIIVEGPDGLLSANADFNYFTAGAHLVGTVLKKRGETAKLLHSPWEVLQAQSTGMDLIPNDRWNLRDLLLKYPDRFSALVEYRRQVFTDLGIGGRVAVYGIVHAGRSHAMLSALEKQIPGLSFVVETEQDLLSLARLTKDNREADYMRSAGRKTCEVVQSVFEYIATGHEANGIVLHPDGRPMTIGDVKTHILQAQAARGLESPTGTIFAQGRDAGLPHAMGDEPAPLRLGSPIVFDIFPREMSSFYYHDMTRTLCIGYATPEMVQLHADVLEAFNQSVASLKVGKRTKLAQDLVCEIFDQRGHPVIAKKFPLDEGYIHSLGHGIGLDIHEDYGFPAHKDRGDEMLPGAVFTIEPGLYYPSKGLGCRIEDTIYCRPDGTFESFTTLSHDLKIVKLKG